MQEDWRRRFCASNRWGVRSIFLKTEETMTSATSPSRLRQRRPLALLGALLLTAFSGVAPAAAQEQSELSQLELQQDVDHFTAIGATGAIAEVFYNGRSGSLLAVADT
jgi:hypothetical protein